MNPNELKTFVLGAVKRAADLLSTVKMGDVRNNMPSVAPFDNRGLDRALQILRREGSIQYLGKRDPRGKVRKRWGWQPVTKRGTRRG